MASNHDTLRSLPKNLRPWQRTASADGDPQGCAVKLGATSASVCNTPLQDIRTRQHAAGSPITGEADKWAWSSKGISRCGGVGLRV